MSFHVGPLTQSWAQKSQIPVWYEPTTTSTNLIAKEKIISEQPISLYVTNHQTQGRGRGDHSWSDTASEKSTLLMTWVFLMRNPPQPVLSPAIGLSVWSALKTTFPWLPLSLKAPNDLYLGPDKLAGLLIENVQQGDHHRLLVGLGMNIWKTPAQVAQATSLGLHCETELNEIVWMNILDRMLLELGLAISQTRSVLSPSQVQSLKLALNQFPGLRDPYQKVDSDGSLWTNQTRINWSEL
jgi:BirA family biotin operon repressor/biotin-[acetyl-CoA-carboxylase] ligase